MIPFNEIYLIIINIQQVEEAIKLNYFQIMTL